MEYSFWLLLINDMNKANSNITVLEDNLSSNVVFGSARLYSEGVGDN